MRDHRRHHADRVLLAAVVAGCLLVQPVLGAEPAGGLRLMAELGAGCDSNMFREASSQQGSLFFPYDVKLSGELLPSIASRLRVDFHSEAALYPKPSQDGRTRKHGLELRYDRRLVGENRRLVRMPSLDVVARCFVNHRDRVYYSRTSGEEYTVVSQGDTFRLRDRYNSWAFGGEAEVKFRSPRSTQWIVEYRLMRRDYCDDYEEIPDVDALDYDNSRCRFRVRQRLGPSLRLELEYALSRSEYDEWRARDLDGNEVDGVVQIFDYATAEVTLKTRGLDWGQVGVSVQHRMRTDPFQGYYDYTQLRIRPTLKLTAMAQWELTVKYDYSDREYERARVGFNPVRALREDFDHTVDAKVVYHVTDNGALMARASYDNTRESNPAYTFSRLRAWVGYRLSY